MARQSMLELANKTKNNQKLLVYGPSGTGKTCFAATFPGPMLIFDFDGKAISAARNTAKERLQEIDVVDFASLSPEQKMLEFDKETKSIRAEVLAGKYKTVVLDSLTTLSAAILEDYIVRSQKGIKRAIAEINALQDYQLHKKHMQTILGNFLSLPCNVVVIGHSELDKDESTGQIVKKILMPGKFSAELPIVFHEVYHTKINSKGEYVLQTKSDYQTTCRTQLKGLPAEILSSYQELAKYI